MCPGQKGSWRHPVLCLHLCGSCDCAFVVCRWQPDEAGRSCLLLPGLKAHGCGHACAPSFLAGGGWGPSGGCVSVDGGRYEMPFCHLLI